MENNKATAEQLAEHKKKKKGKGLKLALNVEGEPTAVEEHKKFSEWVKEREKLQTK